MTSSFDPTHPVAPARRRTRTARHIVSIVIGCFALLPALAMVGGGGVLAIGQAVATDDDGYFAFTLDRVQSDGVAVTTTDLWEGDVDDDGPWVLDMLDLDVRLRADGAGPTDEVFVGIARTPDVEGYLAGAPYSEVTDIDDHTPEYRQVPGGETAPATIGSPLDQDFWVATSNGIGEQELTWEARGGRWSVVVMNVDGSAGVAADIEVGAKSAAVTPIAVALMVVGGLGVLVSTALIVFGARGRRSPGTPLATQPSSTQPFGNSPFPPPTPETAPQFDDTSHASLVG